VQRLPIGNLAGSGLTPQRAFESCVGEGVEYLSQFLGVDDHVELGPLTTCGDASDMDVRRFIDETLAICSVDADRPIAWVLADRLSDGARLRFPLDLCYRRRASEQDFTPPLKLSSGLRGRVSIEAADLARPARTRRTRRRGALVARRAPRAADRSAQ